jgi:hypothetical protein
MFDTNVWIDVSRGLLSYPDLKGKADTTLVLSPLTITELVRGSVNGSEKNFARDQQMFRCMVDGAIEILELPKVFVYKVLWNFSWEVSSVKPQHYVELLNMLISSNTLSEFLRRAEAPGSS